MKIINKSKGVVLADAIIADTPFKRMKGLLGRKALNEGEALVIKPCNSIHTFFMRFPIDVLFVDKNNKVIKAISSIKPFRITGIYFGAAFVVELSAGTIKRTRTVESDLLSL